MNRHYSLSPKGRPRGENSQATQDAVLAQQAGFEEQLKAISPEIRIVYRYRLALNGFAIYAPPGVVPQVKSLAGLSQISSARRMERPEQESMGPLPACKKIKSLPSALSAPRRP